MPGGPTTAARGVGWRVSIRDEHLIGRAGHAAAGTHLSHARARADGDASRGSSSHALTLWAGLAFNLMGTFVRLSDRQKLLCDKLIWQKLLCEKLIWQKLAYRYSRARLNLWGWVENSLLCFICLCFTPHMCLVLRLVDTGTCP